MPDGSVSYQKKDKCLLAENTDGLTRIIPRSGSLDLPERLGGLARGSIGNDKDVGFPKSHIDHRSTVLIPAFDILKTADA